jgi:hypothetical protein
MLLWNEALPKENVQHKNGFSFVHSKQKVPGKEKNQRWPILIIYEINNEEHKKISQWKFRAKKFGLLLLRCHESCFFFLNFFSICRKLSSKLKII